LISFYEFFSRARSPSLSLSLSHAPTSQQPTARNNACQQSNELKDGAVVKSWLPKANLTVDLSSKPGTVVIKTDSGSTAKVTKADVAAGNAVVHLVDAVLQPRSEDIQKAPERVAAWKAKKAGAPSAAPRRLQERW